MKVKMLTSIASADFSYAIGEVRNIDDKLAIAWIESGIAQEVKESRTATNEAPETASAKTFRRKKGDK